MPLDRQSSHSRLVMSVFWLLAIATQLNFNHVSNMIVGTGWFVTLGYALCGIFLILAVRVPFRQALGLPGYLIAAALTSYLLIGAGVTLVTDAEWRLGDYRLPLHAGFALVLIVASGFGARVVLRRIGAEELLARILVVKAIVCILILATPLLVEHLYHALPETYRWISRTRFMGTFQGANTAGIVACQTVVLALSLLNGRYRGLSWWIAILASVAVVVTFSRAAILALILVVVFFTWSAAQGVYSRRRHTAAWLVLFVIAAGFVLMAANLERLPLEPNQLRRLAWITTFATSGGDINVRFEVWPLALSHIAESPLFGHGLSQFHILQYAPPDCHDSHATTGKVCGVHNTYMMFWGEAGIVPLALLLLFVGALLRMRLVLPKSIAIDTVTGWTLVFAVECMSTDDVPFFAWNAFIIGLSCALVTHAARGSRAREAPGTRAGMVAHGAASP